MSKFLTAFISKKIDIQQINRIGKKYNLYFSSTENLNIKKFVFDIDMHCYLVEWINDKYNIAVDTRAEVEGEYRTIDFLRDMFGNKHNEVEAAINSECAEKNKLRSLYYTNWNQFLGELVLENDCEIGLLIHWYSEAIKEEVVTIKNSYKIFMTEVNKHSAFMVMDEDVLYVY